MRKLFTCFCIISVSVQLHAQNPFARYKVEHYDSKNGMPNDFVMNTYQTMDGFIWMSSYSGYIRFDGKQFVNFNSGNTPVLKTDNSNSLFTESEDSTLWLPTAGGGLVAYKKGRFTPYLPEHSSLYLMGKTKDGELILGHVGLDSTSALLIFSPKTRKYFTIKQEENLQYNSIAIHTNVAASNNWHVANGRVQHKEENGIWRKLGMAEGLSPQDFFSSIYQDSKGRTWLTSLRGILLWNGKQFKPFPGMETVAVPAPNPSFGYIVEDAEKGIWVSIGNGVACLPDGSDRFYTFPKQDLNIQTVHNITIDREQNIWLATDRGVYKLSKTKVINYAEPEGIPNNRVSTVCEFKPGEFLITNIEDKLYWLKNGLVQPYQARHPEALKTAFNFIHSKVDSKGNAWICYQTGVIKISGQEETNYPMPGQTRYAVEGLDGRMYFALSYKGIAYINEHSEIKFLDFPKIDFSQAFISSLHQLKDSSWLVTTYRTGAMIIDKNGNAQKLDLFNGAGGVPIFNAIEGKSGVIWFATGRGLVKWNKGQVQIIGTETGLKELNLFSILPDQQGNWWFPTNKGIFYAKYAQLEAYLENSNNKINWKYLDDGDGMNNRQCVGARHSIVAKDGKLLVLGIGGLVEVDPYLLKQNLTPPFLSINSLQVDDSLHYAENAVVISPGDHRYVFDYSALSFVAPGKNQIRFRLVGRDRGWIESKGDNRAFYTDLAPGDYTFEVIASNNDGLWATTPATYRFTVKPFFYQTLWFKIVSVFLVLGICWLLILWRTRAAREKNTWLEKQVAQRTAELKNSLDQLQSTQKQLIQTEKMASLGELTAGIAHEIQNPLNFVNNFSEVNKELSDELEQEIEKGNYTDAKEIAKDIKDNSDKISHHGKRADAIVKGMLQHSRSSSGVKEPTDINALCDEYLRLAYHGLRAKDNSFNVKTETNFDDSIGKISVMPQDMGRVILNIISNAFYAVDEKKKQAGSGYEPTVTVSTKKNNGKVEVKIADNGNGIPQRVLDKIFQPFFTTKPTGQGTGLGLSLAYDIVKAHGGVVEVETKEGEGSAFIIQLPVT